VVVLSIPRSRVEIRTSWILPVATKKRIRMSIGADERGIDPQTDRAFGAEFIGLAQRSNV
jgi:hypothetical protein